MLSKHLTGVFLFISTALFLSVNLQAQNNIRIMPLGDSITYGDSSPSDVPGGYRLPLYTNLVNAGYNIDYVGSSTDNAATGLGTEINHDGHCGWRVSHDSIGLYEHLYDWFELIEDPHVVLIHAGTNDTNDPDFENCINEMDAMITRIAKCQPDAKIILTTLMKRGSPTDTRYIAITNDFNPYVYPLVTNHVAQGHNVYYLDMHSHLELSDMPDNLHPDAAGYQKMADAWFPVITNIIDISAGPNRPAPIRAHDSETSRTSIEISFNKIISQDSATNISNYAIDGGLTVTAASLSGDQRTVTLTTSLQTDDTLYTVLMNNIADETTPTALEIPADSQVQFSSPVHPLALSASCQADNQHVDILFSKPVSEATATATSNYSISGGINISGASISADHLTVTLDISTPTGGTEYIVTMNNIEDESIPSALTIPANSEITFFGITSSGAENHVDEFEDYTLVYSLNIPSEISAKDKCIIYNENNATRIPDGSFSRIAYYLELRKANEDRQYLWVSMDAFTDNPSKIGVPVPSSGAVFQQILDNLKIYSNVGGVTTGSSSHGNIEFWPSNYHNENAIGIPGADISTYDFGDTMTPGSYGSMQIHNYLAGQTLFSFSNWGSSGDGPVCLGIGNNTSNENPDWTFMNNGAEYIEKTLKVYVKVDTVETTPPAAISAEAGAAGTLITVEFSEELAQDSITSGGFTLDNGVSVISTRLLDDRKRVVIDTSYQPSGTPLTLTINNIRDLSGNKIAKNTTISVDLYALPAAISTNAGSLADGYRHIYTLDITPVCNFTSSGSEMYSYDQSSLTGAFDRVAYYMELVKPDGSTQYVWTSMDAFTLNKTLTGVPTFNSGAIFQQYVSNLVVKSNVSGVWNGTKATGNIEFWPYDYTNLNGLSIPGASGSSYDFGDTRKDIGNYGSMQVHNYLEGQTVFGFNCWNRDYQEIGVGIGNNPSSSSYRDWTHTFNGASDYIKRTLYVLVHPSDSSPMNPPTPDTVAENVPASSNYLHAYTIDIPVVGYFNIAESNAVYTSTDNTGLLPENFKRVAYYLELVSGTTTQYVWTAMDKFTDEYAKLKVPVYGTFFQQYVSNLDVLSNVGGIVNGNSITTGNIEFWPSSYKGGNTSGVPNATDTFDFGDCDGNTSTGYGSMQVHNYGESQTLFAINRFNSTDSNEICTGIGNNTSGTGYPDWTHYSNAGTYDKRTLYVFVQPDYSNVSTIAAPAIVRHVVSRSLNALTVTFDRALADSAADPANFTLDNEVIITGASLLEDLRTVRISTSALTAGLSYTLTVNNIRSRATNSEVLNTTRNFTVPALDLPGFMGAVPEVGDYSLAYQLSVGSRPYYALGCNYTFDESLFAQSSGFDRIAYCMELVTGSTTNWAWASMDAFTTDMSLIGVPTPVRGNIWQQKVNNMNVYAAPGAAVTTGVGIATGNIEFWPNNYSTANAIGIPNANDSRYDFGDVIRTDTLIGHGSMQVHNYAESQTILSMVHFIRSGEQPGIGIGNNPNWAAKNDPDWTFQENADSYTVKNIYVLTRPANIPFEVTESGDVQILLHPQSTTVKQGATVSLSVYAPYAASYKWLKDGCAIPGASSSTLELTDTLPHDSAQYSVVVTESDGDVAESNPANVKVLPSGTVIILK